jgi:glc operon protein GlcG
MADETSKTQATERDGLTRRRALGYGGAVAAGVAVSQVAAGGAAAAAGTSEVMRSITLAQANRIVAAGVRYASRTTGVPPMFILVVDACGDEKASRRMDGNGPASVVLVPVKAHTSRSFRASTADLAERTTDPARIASFTAAGFSLLGGGRPIFDGDVLIGAIGVGGGTPEQDDEVAAAALRAL